jgi:transposase-like protein
MIERLRPKSATAVMTTVGAPTKYDPKIYPRIAKLLAQRGAILSEIADCFDVTTRTLSNWLNDYPELREAIDAGNDVFNPRVERALAERAIGFYADVEEVFVIDKKLEKKIVRKYYPPDVRACIFFLKNRQSDRWRDVQRHEVNPTSLRSSEEIRQALLKEFQDMVDQGLLQLPAPRRMKA